MTTLYNTDDTLKMYIGLEDALEDSLVSAVNLAACRGIDEFCGRRFYLDASATARWYIADGRVSERCTVLDVDDIGATAGLIVATDQDGDGTAETTWTITTHYQLEPVGGRRSDGVSGPFERIRSFRGAWPQSTGRALVEITAQWGWPSVPSTVAEVALQVGKDLYRSKNAVSGSIGFADLGIIRIRESPIYTARLWPYVRTMGFA